MAFPTTGVQKRHLELLTSSTDAMRREEVFTDVVLVCRDRELPAHRLALAAASPYFRAMLQTPMIEADTGRIDLKSLDPDALEHVVTFIYTGQTELASDDRELVSAVIEASHFLQVEPLFEYAIRMMSRKLKSDNFLEIWNTAEFYNHTNLLANIKRKLANEFDKVACSQDFLQITPTQLQELLVLMNPNSADSMLRAMVNWAKVEEPRTCDLSSLVKHVPVNYLSETCLKDVLQNEPLVQQVQEVYSLLVSATLPYLDTRLPEWSKSSGKSNLLCFAKHCNVSKVFIRDGQWSEAKILPFALTKDMSTLGYNFNVYIFGCRNAENRATDEVWKYSPATNKYSKFLRLNIPVFSAVATDLLGFIYVVGGFDTQNPIPTPSKIVQRFSITSKECEQMASTYHAHWFPTIGQLRGFLYLTGNSTTIERYNPETNQWTCTNVTPIPTQPFGCCGAFAEGKFYVMADKRSPNDLLVYDPLVNDWKKLAIHGSKPADINGRWTIRTNESDRSVMLIQEKRGALYCFNPGYDSWQVIPPVSLDQFSLAEFCIVQSLITV